MKTFLQYVAESLLNKFGSNLSGLTVVFPGKRASLFLNQYLAEASPTPVWAPRYQTISELFEQASPYALCDSIESVCRLYRAYEHHVEDPQSLDRFYSWGEILLADFDDVDKHLVDADKLFANIHDVKALDDNSFLSKEQEKALNDFFRNFSIESNTELKERFLRLWNQMHAIYAEVNEEMRRDGVLYEGALQREVVERLRKSRLTQQPDDSLPAKTTYVFVGFNVLNAVEEALFDELQARGQALFYWDYDRMYLADHEAGYFIRLNLKRYGNELPESCYDNFRAPKEITFIASPGENAQARYLPQWLKDSLTPQENQTAVVLCNEQLLQPVLHSLPSNPPQAVNVSMGFSLADTPVFSFVNLLLTLQTDGYDAARKRFRTSAMRAVETHPFAKMMERDVWCREAGHGTALLDYLLEVVQTIASAFNKEEGIYAMLYAEALFKTFTCLSRLRDLMTGDAPLFEVNDQTLRRVLRSIMQSQSVPFHGEPAVGLQVLGVLETRALDFSHLLMLSVGEGFLPKAVSDTSFIPYFLRDAFGLTTIRHKVAVYAYYFYRLIQRAERVTFVYNESNAGTRQNEMSRFLRQLLAETEVPVTMHRLVAQSIPLEAAPITIEKTPEVIHQLRTMYDHNYEPSAKKSPLSPSAMNCYTTCPLQFYYRYIKGMTFEPDPQDGLDAILFGDIFHRAAELLYLQLTSAGPVVREVDIEPFLEKEGVRLEPFVRQAFREIFFKNVPEEYQGILIIAKRVLQTYLVQLLRHDLHHTPFTILGLEKRRTMTLQVGGMTIKTGGTIDRLDLVADENVKGGVAVRVVDYKTGGQIGNIASMERLFHETGQREHYYFQTILYASIVAQQEQRPVTPCLFYAHRSGSDDYSPKLKLARRTIHDVNEVAEDFRDRLEQLIAEIMNPEVPFTQTAQKTACQHCHFNSLCQR